jgi:hypothetical protein
LGGAALRAAITNYKALAAEAVPSGAKALKICACGMAKAMSFQGREFEPQL